MNYEDRSHAAYKISRTTTRSKAISLIILTQLAADQDEAEQLIQEGKKVAIGYATTQGVGEIMTREQRASLAYMIAKTNRHEDALTMIIAKGLATDAAEATTLIKLGAFIWADPPEPDIDDMPLPRYDPVMQEAEDQLAKRHGRRAAQEMIDEEDILNSGKGR